MGDLIRQIGDAVDRYGFVVTFGIILMVMLVYVLWQHMKAMNRWAESSEARLKSVEEDRKETTKRAEARQDSLLVQNANLAKSLIEVNKSQDEKLDQLVTVAQDHSELLAGTNKKLTEMNSDQKRLCKAEVTADKVQEMINHLDALKKQGLAVAADIKSRLEKHLPVPAQEPTPVTIVPAKEPLQVEVVPPPDK